MNDRAYATALVLDAAGRIVATIGAAASPQLVDDPRAERVALPNGGWLVGLRQDDEGSWHRLARAFVHEARSPLNALAIYLELVSSRLAPGAPPARPESSPERILQKSNDQVKRLDELLHTFSTVWAPRSEEGADLARVARGASRFATHEGSRKGIRLQSIICEKAPVDAEPDLLANAIVLLLGGATRAPEGSSFDLSVSTDDAGATLTLRSSDATDHARHLARGARTLEQAGGTVSALPDGISAHFRPARATTAPRSE